MDFIDSTGRVYRTDATIGLGGEATVFKIAGSPDFVAKIYTAPQPEQADKVAWMRDHPPDDPARDLNHASIAWPSDLLYDPEGLFAGYIMPRIHGAVGLLDVFNPRRRNLTLPNFNEIYLHRTARNLASALGALHERDYIVGDLNESNIMVTPTTLVTMIDTDSFQVRARTRLGRPIVFRCPVGKYEYLPPELQGGSIRNRDRTEPHDRFALGVLIFQLLMDGSHPFRARWLRDGDPPPIEDRIREGWYPHSTRKRRLPVEPPQNVVPLDALHPHLSLLFRRCFEIGHRNPKARPAPEEWEAAFAQAERALQPCGRGHYYSEHLSACPKCARQEIFAQHKGPERRIRLVERIQSLQNANYASAPVQAPTARRGRTTLPAARLFRLPARRRLPSFKLNSEDVFENTAYLLASLLGGAAGQTLLFGLTGLLVGALLGPRLGSDSAGALLGGIGGFLGGAMLSDAIRRKVNWGIFLGIAAAAATGLALYALGLEWQWIAVSASAVAVVGLAIGIALPPRGWTLVSAVLSALIGIYVGRAIGLSIGTAWMAAGLSGACSGFLLGLAYAVWRRIEA
jgi:DNA-binding helix-hairpin-helix protein with protein kinase domain